MDENQKTEVKDMIATAITAATDGIVRQATVGVAEAVKQAFGPLAERLDAAESAAKAAGEKAKPPGDAEAAGLTEDRLAAILDARDAKAAETVKAARADQAGKDAAAAYAGEKMKDIPRQYHGLLPATEDAAKLAEAEKSIRDRFKADARAAGFKAADVGEAGPPAGGPGSAGPDISKMTPVGKIAAGLKPVQ